MLKIYTYLFLLGVIYNSDFHIENSFTNDIISSNTHIQRKTRAGVGQVDLSGNVYNDVNGNLVKEVNEQVINGQNTSGVNINTILFANLIDVNGLVHETTTVDINGNYIFTTAPQNENGLTIQISTIQGVLGMPKPTASLVGTWYNTGEVAIAAGTNDIIPDGEIKISTDTLNITNLDFGIQQEPVVNSQTLPIYNTSGGVTFELLPSTTFSAIDSNGGSISYITVLSFPTNADSMKVGIIVYNNSNFPIGGLMIPTNSQGIPIEAISICPISGNTNVNINYSATDNANKISINNATITIPFVYTGTPLNATINYFNVYAKECSAILTWETLQEVNISSINILRKIDGRTDFEIVSTITPKGNATETATYNFVDKNVSSNVYTYALQFVNNDNTKQLSDSKNCTIQCNSSNEILLYPNPATTYINVDIYNGAKATYTIELYTILGQKIIDKIIEVNNEHKVIPIDINVLQTGNYFVTVKDDNSTIQSFKIQKK